MSSTAHSFKTWLCISKRGVACPRLFSICINNKDPKANHKLVKVLLSTLKSTSIL